MTKIRWAKKMLDVRGNLGEEVEIYDPEDITREHSDLARRLKEIMSLPPIEAQDEVDKLRIEMEAKNK